jgi:hypothetical protein
MKLRAWWLLTKLLFTWAFTWASKQPHLDFDDIVILAELWTNNCCTFSFSKISAVAPSKY